MIRNIILERTQNPQVAEDITAEAFFKVMAQARFKPHDVDARTYMITTAKRLLIDEHRKEAAHPLGNRTPLESNEVFDQADNSIYANPTKVAERKHTIMTLNAALSRLKKIEQQALVYEYRDGMSYKEIGNLLGKTEAAVKTIIYRAKEHLKEILEKEEFDV